MSNISKEIQSGAFFLFLGRYSNLIIQIIITGVLARLITPHEFGVVAIAMVFILFFNSLSDFGFGPALVQQRIIKKLDIDSLFWVTFFQGVILVTFFLSIKNFIVEFYDNDELNNILFYLSFTIFFTSLNTVPYSLNRRHKKFKYIGWSNVIINLITGSLAIILAIYYSYGIYALVIKVVFDSIILFLYNLKVANYVPSLNFSIYSIRRVFKYSAYQFLYNVLHYFSRNIDNLFIGKYLGSTSLGYYDKSYKLMIMPVQNLTNVIAPVLHPVLAKYQDDKTIIALNYLNLVKLLSIIGFPLSVFIYFSSSEIIMLVYGADWVFSIIPFQFLAVSIGFQMVTSSARGVFQALGKTKLLFTTTLFTLILISISLYVGISIYSSLNVVSLLVSASYVLTFIYVIQMVCIKSLKVKYIDLWKSVESALYISLVLIFIYKVNFITLNSLLLSILYKTFLFVFTYIIITFLLKERFIIIVLNKIKSNLQK